MNEGVNPMPLKGQMSSVSGIISIDLDSVSVFADFLFSGLLVSSAVLM